jgi:Predicted xylanase/chitin deacetylase
MGIRFLYPEGKIKALTMSYDDGVVQDRRLVALFNAHGIKGTFHINAGILDQGNRIASSELKSLYAGHEVSCHTVSHPFLERVPRTEVTREIFEDRKRLEELCGYPVIGMSYPFGTWNGEVIDIAKACGIVYSRSTRVSGGFGIPQDFMAWDATCHHREMLEKGAAFLEFNRYPLALFYVWGHAYEFDNNDNWNEIEEFCRMMSNQDNVWYATNIEIYRYFEAIRGLVVSADGRIAYNPSATAVWYCLGEKKGVIGAGETVTVA